MYEHNMRVQRPLSTLGTGGLYLQQLLSGKQRRKGEEKTLVDTSMDAWKSSNSSACVSAWIKKCARKDAHVLQRKYFIWFYRMDTSLQFPEHNGSVSSNISWGEKITTTAWSELSGGHVVAFGYSQLEPLFPWAAKKVKKYKFSSTLEL